MLSQKAVSSPSIFQNSLQACYSDSQYAYQLSKPVHSSDHLYSAINRQPCHLAVLVHKHRYTHVNTNYTSTMFNSQSAYPLLSIRAIFNNNNNNNEKSAQRCKHCTLAVVRSQKILTRCRPLPGGAGWPKFNQLEMVTTCTYRLSLVKINARNFELSL